MELWAICTKMIDGKEVIVNAGKDLIITDNYYRTMRVEEVVARQMKSLEIVDGELRITEPLLSLEELNRISDEEDLIGEEPIIEEEQTIITPVNMEIKKVEEPSN